MPIGPFAAKAGIEIGKQLAKGVDNKRQRDDAKSDAELRRLSSFLEARQSLIEAVKHATGPEHREALIAQLNRLQDAETQGIKATERGKTIRRGIVASTLVGVVAAGAVAAVKGFDAISGTVVPEVKITTEQKLGAALTKVEQRSDKIIATGNGTGEAKITTRANVGMFGLDVRLPGGLVGSEAAVTIPRNLDMVSRAGAVTLRPIQDQKDGSWDVLALVDPAKITPQVSGDQPPAPDSGATSGFFNDLAHALGFNETEQTELYQSAESLAVDSFEASAARIMAQPRTLAALEANSIRQDMQEVGGATPPGPVHDALAQLATADIHVAFVSVDANSGGMAFIDPSDPTALQAHMSLPKPPTSSTVRVSAVEISMATPAPDQQLMSQESRNNLAAIENQPGYQLVTDPSVVAPYAATQSPN